MTQKCRFSGKFGSFGAEDEIRTRATFNSATPLAGEHDTKL